MQLVDATQWFRSLRKNMGKKNCEFSPDDIRALEHETEGLLTEITKGATT